MRFEAVMSLSTVVLFVGMLLLVELGRRIGARRIAADPEGARAGVGPFEGALFALLGLLLAFTFSGASSRFDMRRQLIVDETNAIGTAYLRLDVLAPEDAAWLRDAFRRYLDERIEAYRRFESDESRRVLGAANTMQAEIWRRALTAIRAPGALPAAPVLVLSALNAMFDITTTRSLATEMHPPRTIYVMLFGIALASALLAGIGMGAARSRAWLHMVLFAAAVSIAIYVIVDMEYPRFGLIRVDAVDQALVDLRQSMK
jgi:hypothetical protein